MMVALLLSFAASDNWDCNFWIWSRYSTSSASFSATVDWRERERERERERDQAYVVQNSQAIKISTKYRQTNLPFLSTRRVCVSCSKRFFSSRHSLISDTSIEKILHINMMVNCIFMLFKKLAPCIVHTLQYV